MKTAIHPNYNSKAKIRCACGNAVELGSTQDEILVELCSACHPFFTGKQKLLDTAGRVDKYKKKVEKKESVAATRLGKKVKKERETAKKVTKEKKEK